MLLSKTGPIPDDHNLADDFEGNSSCFEGSTSHQVEKLHNQSKLGNVRVACEMRLLRCKSSHTAV